VIGVAVSTHQRPHILAKALSNWARFMPDVLVVIHDVDGTGVAATKNRGIAMLMDAQPEVEHLFLADDDMWPITPHWAGLYVNDPEPHLMHCWGRRRLIADDGYHTTWTHPRGVLLYAERRVIERVGGMRLDFGPKGGGEHAEWSTRIHNCGLTTYRYADVSAAKTGVWHCEDYARTTPSTIGSKQLEATKQLRHDLYRKYRHSTDHIPYHY
jgi:hypothetical protein